jgi:Spy/CpxP family protein refolding chaperone
MKHLNSKHILLVLTTAVLAFTAAYAQAPATGAAQGPPGAGAPPGQGGRGGRGGGLPGATPEQNQAVADMNTALAPLVTAATTARNELATVAFADVKNQAAIGAAVEKVRAAELALASARADAFARLQASPCKLTPEQVTALLTAASNPGGRGGGFGGGGGRGPGGGAAAAPAAAAPAAPAASNCGK